MIKRVVIRSIHSHYNGFSWYPWIPWDERSFMMVAWKNKFELRNPTLDRFSDVWTIVLVFGVDEMVYGCYKDDDKVFLDCNNFKIGFFPQKTSYLIFQPPPQCSEFGLIDNTLFISHVIFFSKIYCRQVVNPFFFKKTRSMCLSLKARQRSWLFIIVAKTRWAIGLQI